jgi:hypothetical protein
MLKIILSSLFVFTVLTANDAIAQQKTQTVFNVDDAVQKEVAVPAAVVAVLKSERIVDDCFKSKDGRPNEAAWFAASEIDLNGDGRKDLIVKAKDACLYGANQAPFWIFENAADGYQKILSASGLQLDVLAKNSSRENTRA